MGTHAEQLSNSNLAIHSYLLVKKFNKPAGYNTVFVKTCDTGNPKQVLYFFLVLQALNFIIHDKSS